MPAVITEKACHVSNQSQRVIFGLAENMESSKFRISAVHLPTLSILNLIGHHGLLFVWENYMVCTSKMAFHAPSKHRKVGVLLLRIVKSNVSSVGPSSERKIK